MYNNFLLTVAYHARLRCAGAALQLDMDGLTTYCSYRNVCGGLLFPRLLTKEFTLDISL